MNKSYKLKKDTVLMITLLIATLQCCISYNMVDILEDSRSNSVDREYHNVMLGISSLWLQFRLLRFLFITGVNPCQSGCLSHLLVKEG